MSFTRVIYRHLKGEAWPVVVPMYRLRQCPECGALVLHWDGQELHEAWHQGVDEEFSDDAGPALDGYVIGSGQLPAETRGGED